MTAPWMPPLPSAGTLAGEPLAWTHGVEQAMRQAQADAARAALEEAAQIIDNDVHAVTFQTFGQYRTSLLKDIRRLAKEITP